MLPRLSPQSCSHDSDKEKERDIVIEVKYRVNTCIIVAKTLAGSKWMNEWMKLFQRGSILNEAEFLLPLCIYIYIYIYLNISVELYGFYMDMTMYWVRLQYLHSIFFLQIILKISRSMKSEKCYSRLEILVVLLHSLFLVFLSHI